MITSYGVIMLAAVSAILGNVKDTPTLTMAVLGLILAIGAFAYQTQLVINSQQQVIQVVKENTESSAVLRGAVLNEGKDTAELLEYLKRLDDRLRKRGI